MLNTDQLLTSIDQYWEKKIIPTLSEYIEIPAKSPAFDPEWEKNGHLEKVLQLVTQWIDEQKVPGLTYEVLRAPHRTPFLLLNLPGQGVAASFEILMYGHLDKQPEMTGWSEGLGPWKAVRRGEKLYGRGGADDGYAVFATVCALQHLIEMGDDRPSIKAAIEFCEESGSSDLPFYFETYSTKFGNPNLIICLDSGAGNYEQFWSTTSLRGLVSATLKVQVLNEGVHSGDASGVVPSSFRIARLLLNRIENPETGEILVKSLKTEIPAQRIAQVKKTAQALGDSAYTKFPFAGSTRPMSEDIETVMLNRTWRAALSVVGAEGLPEISKAGNVLRPQTTLKLSIRVPPNADAEKAAAEVKDILEKEPPYNAQVSVQIEDIGNGWDAPPTVPALDQLLDEASQKFYGKDALNIGEGGTIPFMGMLGKKYPKAQFVITGVLGPASNAHGPNEFIHLDYAKKLTACVTYIVQNAYSRMRP